MSPAVDSISKHFSQCLHPDGMINSRLLMLIACESVEI